MLLFAITTMIFVIFPIHANKACDRGYIAGPNQTCYYICCAGSFADANRECGGYQGLFLVSIHNRDTNDFLTRFLGAVENGYSRNDRLWIGGFLAGRAWQWTDGSPFNFTNWAPGISTQKVKPHYSW